MARVDGDADPPVRDLSGGGVARYELLRSFLADPGYMELGGDLDIVDIGGPNPMSTVAASMTTRVPSGAEKFSVPEKSRWAAGNGPATRARRKTATIRTTHVDVKRVNMVWTPVTGMEKGRPSHLRVRTTAAMFL